MKKRGRGSIHDISNEAMIVKLVPALPEVNQKN
jgi:hypothetical protein